MATLTISDALDAQAQEAADRLGCSKADFIAEAIQERVEYREAPLTESQIAHLLEGVEAVKRGEVVSSEVIDKKFDDFFERTAAR